MSVLDGQRRQQRRQQQPPYADTAQTAVGEAAGAAAFVQDTQADHLVLQMLEVLAVASPAPFPVEMEFQ
jgi:hypothetical protein